MDYYKDYCFDNFENLQSKLNSQGHLNQDVKISGEFKSLGNVTKIYGHFNLDSEHLIDLGELNYVKTDFWVNNEKYKLLSLCNLEKIGGNLSLRYSNVIDLGSLLRVKGNVNLRDTSIDNLGNLKYVGGDLFLPKRLAHLNLEEIEIKGNVKFWNDKKKSQNENIRNDFDWDWDKYFSEIHKLELENKKRFLNGEYLVKRCFNRSKYNQYTIENLYDFISFVDSELISLYDNRFSFYHSLYNELKTIDEINDEFPKIEVDKRTKIDVRYKQLKQLSNTFISKNRNQFPIIKYENVSECFKNDKDWNGQESSIWLRYDEHKLIKCEACCKYEWDPYKGSGENIFEEGFIYYVENKLVETFSIYVDSLQNKFRISRGIPRIGEGWVSETNLFYLVKQKFDQYEVIQHASPKWLGRQHLDIYFSNLNIGIEYQGKQHNEPVSFFGGEEAHLKTLERDDRKKKLCYENNCTLLFVYPETITEDFLKELEIIVSLRKI